MVAEIANAEAGSSVRGKLNDAIGGAPVTASGALTRADHNARWVITSGNVTIPNAAGDVGMAGVIKAGGAHTVTFNATSLSLATGDILTYFVESTTELRRRKSVAADEPAMT